MSEIDRQVGGGHYKTLAIQPMEYNVANKIPWPEGEIIKYVTRWRDKGGVDDLEKAQHILAYLIEVQPAGEAVKADYGSTTRLQGFDPPPTSSQVVVGAKDVGPIDFSINKVAISFEAVQVLEWTQVKDSDAVRTPEVLSTKPGIASTPQVTLMPGDSWYDAAKARVPNWRETSSQVPENGPVSPPAPKG